MNFSFNAETHEYKVGSRIVPACTHVLAGGGLIPFAMVDAEILERKSALGREAHKACHLHNRGILASCDAAVKPFLDSWILFKEKMKFQPRLSECQMVAELHGMSYGMQIDCLGTLDGEETVIEWKVGDIYPHHGVQLAGYASGWPHDRWANPLARFHARKRIALQLRANGNLPKITRFKEQSDFFVFSSLLYVSTWKKQFKNYYQEKI